MKVKRGVERGNRYQSASVERGKRGPLEKGERREERGERREERGERREESTLAAPWKKRKQSALVTCSMVCMQCVWRGWRRAWSTMASLYLPALSPKKYT